MRFIGRWLADVIGLAVPLALAILFMQLPALTAEYVGALLQVTNDAQRDIDQREASARGFYNLPPGTDEELVEGLRSKEPSNAETLSRSIEHARMLRAAHARIEGAPPLLQPPTALLDALDDASGVKRTILRTAWQTHVVQIAFGTASAIYGLVGLLAGALLSRVLVAVLGLRGRARYGRAA